MKQAATVILMASSIMLFSSCYKNSIKGEGTVTSDTRSVPSFSSVAANGDVDVEIHASETDKVIVTGYQNLVPVYKTKVRDGRLTLEFEDQYWNVRNNNIKVDVYTRDVDGVIMNGSGDIYVGADAAAENMNAEINGSGNITISTNNCHEMNLKVNGSGDINARSAHAENSDVRISGSGDIKLTVHSYLDAHITGSGNIDYWGNPERVDTEISGSGKIRKQ
jgi:hypothetical protein